MVKQVLEAGGDAVSRFQREVTALRFAAGVSPQVVPALLGVDEAERVMVLEYLPAGRSSEPWAVDYATALSTGCTPPVLRVPVCHGRLVPRGRT